MPSIMEIPEPIERPRGMVWLAGIFFALGALILIYGALIGGGGVSFTGAAWLVGMEAARMGPAAFAIGALLYFAAGFGLLRTYRWGRWLAMLLLIAGMAEQAPVISAAVIDFHFAVLAREGLLFVGRIVATQYLWKSSQPSALSIR